MKILHVTPCYEPAFEMGGIVKSESLLCRGLVKLGAEVTVFTTNTNSLGNSLKVAVNTETDAGGVKVWYFETKYFKKRFYYSPELGKACYQRIKEFELLHLTSFWCYPGIPAGRAARKYKVPYIISPRGTLDRYSLKHNRLQKALYLQLFENANIRGAAAVHFTSELEKECSIIPQNPSFLAANPAEIGSTGGSFDRKKAREYHNIPENYTVLSYMGRLHKRKAIDLLILSFKQILNSVPRAVLLIAGPDDGVLENLKKIVNDNKLQDSVRFLGYVSKEKKELLLAASDLFWYATYPGENFGHSAVEAMHAGVPVIFSRDVGICKDALANAAGIVVEHNVESAANEILALLRDKERMLEISENAKKQVRLYSSEKIAEQMYAEYEKVIKGVRENKKGR